MRRLVKLLGFLAVIWATGLIWYAGLLPRTPPTTLSPTDGIVVLTGGQNRLPEALFLLDQNLGQRLLISGVDSQIDDPLLQKTLGLDQGVGRDMFDCCVDVGREALDTEGNAREIVNWAAQQNYGSLRVVTAGYHMPRSLLEIRRFAADIELVPHPVFSDSVKLNRWWRYPGTASVIAGEYNKYLIVLLKMHVLDKLNESARG
ncbi:MAG: YdcF family protein [Alphaproteobacteria bacterium]